MKKGDRVVCIDASIKPGKLAYVGYAYPNWIKEGETYTVRGFNDNDGIVHGILLEEVTNPLKFFKLINRFQEPSFRLDRFRKLAPSEVKQNVEQFETVI